MSYKVLMAQIERIASPITVRYDGRTREFANGKELALFELDAPYTVSEIKADENTIIVRLEPCTIDDSVGSFF